MSESRRKLMIEMAEEYTGYPARVIRNAVARGELTAERPGGGQFSRMYFDTVELDRWLTSIKVGAE